MVWRTLESDLCDIRELSAEDTEECTQRLAEVLLKLQSPCISLRAFLRGLCAKKDRPLQLLSYPTLTKQILPGLHTTFFTGYKTLSLLKTISNFGFVKQQVVITLSHNSLNNKA